MQPQLTQETETPNVRALPLEDSLQLPRKRTKGPLGFSPPTIVEATGKIFASSLFAEATPHSHPGTLPVPPWHYRGAASGGPGTRRAARCPFLTTRWVGFRAKPDAERTCDRSGAEVRVGGRRWDAACRPPRESRASVFEAQALGRRSSRLFGGARGARNKRH